MSEVESMRFLHNVVDMKQLSDKLKRKFPDEANLLVEKVRVCGARVHTCVCVCVCVCTHAKL